MKLFFYWKSRDGVVPRITKYPCFVLVETKWDDYSYKTQFVLNYYLNSRSKVEVGFIKILKKGTSITVLPSKFSKLSGKYCSIGQSNSFYSSLYQLFTRKEISQILASLNDLTQSKEIFDDFKNEEGLKKSLLRDSEAQKALNEVPFLLQGEKARNSFKFEFSAQIPSFHVPHSASFDFNKRSPLPKRLSAIVGKNGSGKTQYLAKLASSLSGDLEGTFPSGKLPAFSRVIAISYSLFDKFKRPKDNKSFSYYFCGFQSEKEFDSVYGIEKRINRALKQIKDEKKIQHLRNYLTVLIGKELTDDYINNYRSRNREFGFFSENRNYYSRLSSGQILMIVVLTELVAYIREESILLFDEPETHLHPNAISNLVGILYDILKANDSFAIIATHSPQIIQEIPSSSIYYFDCDKTNPPVRELPIETFGENLSTLTERIFGTLDVDENYKKVIRDLSKRKSKKEIIELFDKKKLPLSMNARIFIEYLNSTDEKSKNTTKK